MFEWLRKSTRRSASPLRAGWNRLRGLLKASYDAAQDGTEDSRHWANADSLSADAANSVRVRTRLRNRARYECANNSYAAGILRTLAADTIGPGPYMQLLTDSAEDNRRVEAVFADWAREIGFADKLNVMRQARARDGEAFAVLAYNPRLVHPVKLDLVLVEADRVTTPWTASQEGTVDGIEFDAYGNPAYYHILREHPGGGATTAAAYDRVPASRVLHAFSADRPEQRRGIPEIMAALPLFAQLRRYTLAVIGAAESAADFAGVLYTDSPADEDIDLVDPMDTVELERRMLLTLPSGWKMGQVQAVQPATTYAEFKREILNEIARCLSMPYNIAACNSAGYNYASGRLDHQTYDRNIAVDRSARWDLHCDQVTNAWMDEAILVDGLLPQRLRQVGATWPHMWLWGDRDHVDPSKEARAQELRLRNNTTTLAHEWGKRGLDWEAALRQRARENEVMAELGLTDTQALPTQAGDRNAQ